MDVSERSRIGGQSRINMIRVVATPTFKRSYGIRPPARIIAAHSFAREAVYQSGMAFDRAIFTCLGPARTRATPAGARDRQNHFLSAPGRMTSRLLLGSSAMAHGLSVVCTLRDDGVFEATIIILCRSIASSQGENPTPSAAVIDGQSVKTTEAGGPRGYHRNIRKTRNASQTPF